MNQAELRQLAEERLRDANALLDGQRWAFAYYVAGYAVECALKSCLLARMVQTGWVFRDKVKIEQCRTHNLEELIDLSDLRADLNTRFAVGDNFRLNWSIVTSWRVESRYETRLEFEARAIYTAITDQTQGVLPWIQNFW